MSKNVYRNKYNLVFGKVTKEEKRMHNERIRKERGTHGNGKNGKSERKKERKRRHDTTKPATGHKFKKEADPFDVVI